MEILILNKNKTKALSFLHSIKKERRCQKKSQANGKNINQSLLNKGRTLSFSSVRIKISTNNLIEKSNNIVSFLLKMKEITKMKMKEKMFLDPHRLTSQFLMLNNLD